MSNSIDNLINSAFKSGEGKTMLRQHFESRLDYLGLTPNQFLDSYEMNFRTTNAILDGNFKYLDPINIVKLANFLNVTTDEILNECISYMPSNAQMELQDSKKKTFILDHFNLVALKKDGIISSTKDFGHIEKCICRTYGLNNIYDYAELDKMSGLFSSTNVSLKDFRQKRSFKNKAIKICDAISNENSFNQNNLKSFFPRIRAYSLDIDSGLTKVIRELYKLGITVVFHPSLSSSGSRGVTVQSKGKPAIVLTDHGKKYSTLWHSLIHELYHVIFDMADIEAGRIHISGDDDFVTEKEAQANDFAREYMFPQNRMRVAELNIADPMKIKSYAIESDVHYSIIYDNYCYNHPDQFAKYSKFIRSPWARLHKTILGPLSSSNSPQEFAKYYQNKIFHSTENQ